MSSLSHRSRIQSLHSRLGSNQQQRHQQQQQQQESPAQEQAGCMNSLKVVIPPSLGIEMGLRKAAAEGGLRPLQTNNRKPTVTNSQKEKLKPIEQVIRDNPIDNVYRQQAGEAKQYDKKKPREKKTYKLVEDQDVPSIIKDYKRKIQYKKLECLGFGAFGRVYRVQSLHDKKYWAAKVIAKASIVESNTKKKLLAEINIHRSLKHDYIVRFYNVIEDKYNIYLILELCENRTLSNMLKRRGTLTEIETRYYMGQILTALRYMSDNRILHRDLKLSNVLLDRNMDCKLGDFGLAALLLTPEDRKRTVCGTLHYIAPEILFHKEVDGHNHRVDMWSAGVLMYNLLFGKHPFQVTEPQELRKQIKQNKYKPRFRFPADSFIISPEAKNLITGLLVNDPDKRLSVIDALHHPFFSMEMPTQIPRSALDAPPNYDDLFKPKDTQQSLRNTATDVKQATKTATAASKVTTAIQDAKDINRCYEDTDIQPPMVIMNETIYDPRSQYPLPSSQQKSAMSILFSQPATTTVKQKPSTSTASKRRAVNSNESSENKVNSPDVPPKRLCNDSDIKAGTSITTSDTTAATNTAHITTDAGATAAAATADSSSPSLVLVNKLENTQISRPSQKPVACGTPSRKTVGTTAQLSQSKFDSQGFAIPTALPSRRPMMEQMEDNIKVMIGRSKTVKKENQTAAPENLDFQWTTSNVFVETWVDCSKHYGFAYRLSDGTLGFLYNDGSVLTCCDSSAYYYVSYRPEDDRYVEQIYTQVPSELEKKVHLLQKFGNYEEKELKHDQSIPKTAQLNKIYLLKYYVSEEAITFRLSNGAVQLNFFKHIKLILYDAGKKILFIDSNRKLTRYNTYDVLCSTNTEIINAIQYAFSILQIQNSRRQKALQEERWKRFEKE